MVSIRPLISKFSSPRTSPLVTVPNAAITIGITVTFIFYIIMIIIIYSFEEVEWQQVSSSLKDSSQYFSRSL